jgi:hypothetical protein
VKGVSTGLKTPENLFIDCHPCNLVSIVHQEYLDSTDDMKGVVQP